MTKFSLNLYREILANGLEAGFQFLSYDPEFFGSTNGPECLLRHDIDADMIAALKMAEVEADLGVAATYFFMIRSPIYNLFGRENNEIAQQILSLGHYIGLHYDQGYDALRTLSPDETAENIEREAEWMESEFGSQVKAVSFHQPGAVVLEGGISTGKRINTYDKQALADYIYFSDSNRQFALVKPDATGYSTALKDQAPKNVQLLIHPMWWVYEDTSTGEVWQRALTTNFEIMQRQLLATERAYGSKRDITIK